MNVVVLSEVKNKRGELKTKIVRVSNSKPNKPLDLATINELYEELLNKYKPEQIIITAKPVDGGCITLKNKGYTGDSLKHVDESYWSSLPKVLDKKFIGKYIDVDITIML
jgi:hypothetical protein